MDEYTYHIHLSETDFFEVNGKSLDEVIEKANTGASERGWPIDKCWSEAINTPHTQKHGRIV